MQMMMSTTDFKNVIFHWRLWGVPHSQSVRLMLQSLGPLYFSYSKNWLVHQSSIKKLYAGTYNMGSVTFVLVSAEALWCSLIIPLSSCGVHRVERDKNSVQSPSLEDKPCYQFFSPPLFSVWVWQGENPCWSLVTATILRFSLSLVRWPTTPWRRTPCGRWMPTSPGCKWTNPTRSSLATLSMQSTRFYFCAIFLSPLKVSWFVPGLFPGKYGGAVSRWQRDNTGLSRQEHK